MLVIALAYLCISIWSLSCYMTQRASGRAAVVCGGALVVETFPFPFFVLLDVAVTKSI